MQLVLSTWEVLITICSFLEQLITTLYYLKDTTVYVDDIDGVVYVFWHADYNVVV